jgi:hypothetical protein
VVEKKKTQKSGTTTRDGKGERHKYAKEERQKEGEGNAGWVREKGARLF